MSTFSEQLTAAALQDPLKLQSMMLRETQERLAGGESLIVDPNNTFALMTEMVAAIASGSMTAITDEFNRLYPKRGQTFDDLHRHLSDFEYVGLYATPATTNIALYFDMNHLVNNAELETDEYRLIVIPKDTVFVLGDYKFGIHYPITIRINTTTNNVLVAWDTTIDNPLYSITQGSIEHQIIRRSNVYLLTIRLPVFQFETNIYREDVTVDTGFTKTYTFDNRFYVAKVYYDEDGDGVAEALMHTSLSDTVYDVSNPTAIVIAEPDEQKCRITIPDVFFSNGTLSGRLQIEILTTRGAIDISVASSDEAQITLQIPSGNTYTDVLATIPIITGTVVSTQITGGSNGYTFDELKQRIVDSSFYQRIPVTSAELAAYFNDAGYHIARYRDGVTDRVYRAYSDFTIGAGVLGSGGFQCNLTPLLEYDGSDEGVALVTDNQDGSYMIHPDVIYQLDADTQWANPVLVKEDEVTVPANITRIKAEYPSIQSRIAAFNENVFLFNPVHIRLYTSDQYPVASSYLLTYPVVNSMVYVNENLRSDARVTISQTRARCYMRGFDTVPNGDTIGEYELTLTIRQSNVADTMDVKALVVITGTDGHLVGQILDIAADATELVISLPTDFKVQSNANIVVHDLGGVSAPTSAATIAMTSDVSVYMLDTTSDEDYSSEDMTPALGILINHLVALDPELTFTKADCILLNHQKLNVSFGQQLAQLHNPVRVGYSSSEYSPYETPVYSKYATPIYVRDDNGNIQWSSNELTDWTFDAEIPVYDLDFTAEDGTAVASAAQGSDPSDIEAGMAVEAKGGSSIASLLYVTGTELDAYNPWEFDVGANTVVATWPAESDTITVDDATGIEIGMAIENVEGIPVNTVVTDIDELVITLSNTTTNEEEVIDQTVTIDTPLNTYNRTVILTFHKDPVELGTIDEVQIGEPLIQRITMEVLHEQGAWIYTQEAETFDDSEQTLPKINDDQSAIEISEALYDRVILFMDLNVDVYEKKDHQWLGCTLWYGDPVTKAPNNLVVDTAFESEGSYYITLNDICGTELEDKPDWYPVADTVVNMTIGVPRLVNAVGDPDSETALPARTLAYYSNALMIDAKILMSQEVDYSYLLRDVNGALLSYCTQVGTHTSVLLPATSLFYLPRRNIGTSSMLGADNVNVTIPLELEMKFELYVTSDVVNSVTLQESIRNAIIDIIDEQTEAGTLNCVTIAAEIMVQMSDSIQNVNIGGIKQDATDEDYTGPQTIRTADNTVRAMLKHVLVQNKDTIVVSRALELTFIAA